MLAMDNQPLTITVQALQGNLVFNMGNPYLGLNMGNPYLGLGLAQLAHFELFNENGVQTDKRGHEEWN